MKSVVALAMKDLRLLVRDKAGLFFTFFFPVLYAVFFGVVFSGETSGKSTLPILLVDEDGSDSSREFADALAKAPELSLSRATREEAAALVRRGKRTAYVVLPQGFGKARGRMFEGATARIEIGMDPARKAESGMLQGILTHYAFRDVERAFSDPASMRASVRKSLDQVRTAPWMDPGERERLVRFLTELERFVDRPQGGGMPGMKPVEIVAAQVVAETNRPRSTYEVTFPQGIIWGVLGCAAAFGIGLVGERTKGTLVRLLMSPISRTQILAGKGLICFATTLAASTLLMALGAVAFRIRPNSLPLLALSLGSVSLCFVGIMMLLSVLGRTEAAASGIGWSILTVMAMIGGGMVPLFIMPSWMQGVSHASPVKWAILSMEGAIWRGFTPREMLLPCAILVGIGATCFAVGARAFRWTSSS